MDSVFKTNAGSVRGLLVTGAVFCFIVLCGIFIDVYFGITLGGNLAELPQAADDRFNQFRENKFLGLYNLDLLNAINQILLIPVYIALVIAHRKISLYQAITAFTIFATGSIIMISNNTSLAMMDLSEKYFSTSDRDLKMIYAAAGEALLVSGAHGSSNMFPGFLLPNIGGLLMSVVMLKGKVFSKPSAMFGILGNCLMVTYIICVTFIPDAKEIATLIAMPGGILLIIWMILFSTRLLSISKHS